MISLIAVNLVVLTLALIYEWSFFNVVFMFWIENMVIGIYNIPKILMTKGSEEKYQDDTMPWRIGMVFFYLFHYSIASILHCMVIILVFHNIAGHSSVPILELGMNEIIITALIVFAVSHGISFYTNFIKKKEYMDVNAMRQMIAPYKRVIFVHVFIFFGGYLILFFENAMQILMIIFVLAKLFIDLLQHLRQHKASA